MSFNLNLGLGKIFNFVIKYSIYSLVFLMPLFWLPWPVEGFEFNKQYLLFFLVLLAFWAWLAKMIIVQKQLAFRRTPLDIFVLIFMLVIIISAAFSLDKTSTWLGFYSRFNDSATHFLLLGLFYFVLTNNLQRKKVLTDPSSLTQSQSVRSGPSITSLIRLFLLSSLLVVLVAYGSLWGLWSSIGQAPVAVKLLSFNPSGVGLESLSMFLIGLVTLALGLLIVLSQNVSYFGPSDKKWLKILSSLLLVLGFIYLLIVNFAQAWLGLAIVMFLFILAALLSRVFKEKSNWLIIPIILLLLGLGGYFGFLNKPAAWLAPDNLPRQMQFDYQTAKEINLRAIKERPLLGSGPGTFLIDFTRFKPIEFNNNIFWSIRFDRAPAHFLEIIPTIGILGSAVYLVLLIAALFFICFWLVNQRKSLSQDSSSASLFFVFSLGWLAYLVVQGLYPLNSLLAFAFWLLLVLMIVVLAWLRKGGFKRWTFSFSQYPERGLLINVVLLLLSVVLLALFVYAINFYRADLNFAQGVVLQQAGEEKLPEAIKETESAVNLNKYRSNYRALLSRLYLKQALAESRKPAEERNIQLIQSYAAGAINQAKQATRLSPYLVNAWENLGATYRDVSWIVRGTLPFALEAFEKAKDLEPTNPILFRQLCQLNLISSERDWDKTIGFCQKAIELKPNYLDAHLQLALVYEQKGELEMVEGSLKEALNKIKGVSFQRGTPLARAAAEIYFQLGRVYLNLERYQEAARMFEQAVVIIPEFANARYGLSLAYQNLLRFDDALAELEIINQLNPNNPLIQSKISEIKDQLGQ